MKSRHLLPRWLSSQEPACQGRRLKSCGFNPWVEKILWRRKWQPSPVFLPGEPHRQRSLEGYIPWGPKESDTTERLSTAHTHIYSTQYSVLVGAGSAKWPHPGSPAPDSLPGNFRRMPSASADSAGQQGPLTPPGLSRNLKEEGESGSEGRFKIRRERKAACGS